MLRWEQQKGAAVVAAKGSKAVEAEVVVAESANATPAMASGVRECDLPMQDPPILLRLRGRGLEGS
jgi:hypothetical protein